MFGFRALANRASGPRDSERRVSGRLACSDLRCQFGDVVDLSREGARVAYGRRCPKVRLGEKIAVKLVGVGSPTVLNAEAVWVRRRAFRVASVGLRFVQMDAGDRLALGELAHAALDRRDISRN